jgi:hypothetical protein
MGVPLLPVAELANPVNRPGQPTPGVPIRPNSPTQSSCGLRPIPVTAATGTSPVSIRHLGRRASTGSPFCGMTTRSPCAGRIPLGGNNASSACGSVRSRAPSDLARQSERPCDHSGHPSGGAEGWVNHRGLDQPAPLRYVGVPPASRLGRARTLGDGMALGGARPSREVDRGQHDLCGCAAIPTFRLTYYKTAFRSFGRY